MVVEHSRLSPIEEELERLVITGLGREEVS